MSRLASACILLGLMPPWGQADDRPDAGPLPAPGSVRIDKERGEVILSAVVRHPRDKPCIDGWGERVQAFIGCKRAAGKDALYADYFVFLVDASVEQVY